MADLTVPIIEYQQSGRDDEEIIVEPGYMAAINGENYFIYCVATLPVKDFSSELEFGLWVELSREDFFRYKDALSNDEVYSLFEAEGYLMNDWPGFPGTLGDVVRVKVINARQKPFIIDIEPSDVELSKYLAMGSMTDQIKQNVKMRIEKFYLPHEQIDVRTSVLNSPYNNSVTKQDKQTEN